MKLREISENISHTAKRIHDIERKHKVKPGTEEWFKLWFSLPYLKESTILEGYRIQLERDPNMYVLHIVDTATGKRTEVRGKPDYETTGYDANDKLHQLLDKIGKSANIAELINGEVVTINPKHPDAEKAKAATDVAFNEDKDYMRGYCHAWALDDIKKNPERVLFARIGWHQEEEYEEVDHVFTVDPGTGKAYDVRGEFASVEDLLKDYDYGADEVDVQQVSKDDIRHWCDVGELKPLDENFADGKKKGKSRPGRVKRAGASCKGSVSELRRKAKKYGGEKGKMYHWCANMKGGKK